VIVKKGARGNSEEDYASEKKRSALQLALLVAAESGQTFIVKELLRAGADPRGNYSRALEAAAENGHTETAKVLLEAGAESQGDSSALAAWRLAAKNGHKDTVKALFEWADQHPPGAQKGPNRPQP
jgi:ankyrin repeat protein